MANHRSVTRRTITLLMGLALAALQPARAAEQPVAFALRDCAYVEAIVRAPAERVAGSIPRDFELMVQGGLATLNVGGATCLEATSDLGDGVASFGWVLARIVAPSDLTLRGVEPRVWFYRLEHYVVSGDVYDAVAGASGAERTHVDAVDARVGPVSSALSIDGGGDEVLIDIPLSPPDGGLGGEAIRWRELHRVEDGYSYLEATLRPDANAAATAGLARAAAGSGAEAFLGSVTAGQGLYGADYAFDDAIMDVIPWP